MGGGGVYSLVYLGYEKPCLAINACLFLFQVTTDLHHKCTEEFKGTSSAAPLAAGMFALVLQAKYVYITGVRYPYCIIRVRLCVRFAWARCQTKRKKQLYKQIKLTKQTNKNIMDLQNLPQVFVDLRK